MFHVFNMPLKKDNKKELKCLCKQTSMNKYRQKYNFNMKYHFSAPIITKNQQKSGHEGQTWFRLRPDMKIKLDGKDFSTESISITESRQDKRLQAHLKKCTWTKL